MPPELWTLIDERLAALQEDMTQVRTAQAVQTAQMASLLGNGQPGRLKLLEDKVDRH